MVLVTPKPSFLEASCWSVDVVKGGVGDFLAGFFSTLDTVYILLIFFWRNNLTSSLESNLLFNSAFRLTPLEFLKIPIDLKVLFVKKFLISLSFSTISLTETDWTLPAERPVLTFLHNTGDNS